MAKILRVNMTDRTTTYEDVPDKYKLLGGRGLTSTIIYDEVDATCHPLGPNNKLVFAPGIVTGDRCGRVMLGQVRAREIGRSARHLRQERGERVQRAQ